MQEGVLIKGYGGFYYVKTGEQVWECTLRGRFRKLKQDFMPGDRVGIHILDDKRGVIEEVFPRKNRLLRPCVANVEQVVVVFALKNPDPDFLLLDRILIMIRHEGLIPVICFNKADLVPDTEVNSPVRIYQEAGYRVLVTSILLGTGINEVRDLLQGKISVFAGPSGVGKSSLLNSIQPGLNLKVGLVSSKIGRGRHTTRYVELMELENGGFVADTPGFSVLSLPSVLREDFDGFFPEIRKHALLCRFNSCLHVAEPDCSVKNAVESGEIDLGRYQRYLSLLQEVIQNERRF